MALVFFLIVFIARNAYTRADRDISTDLMLENYFQGETFSPSPGPGSVEDPCPLGTSEKIGKCSSELQSLASTGYPWTNAVAYNDLPHTPMAIRDPLDSLDHICQVFSRFQDCISYHRIKDYCLMIPRPGNRKTLHLNTTFYFICKVAPRSSDTLHALQCLKDTRVLSLQQYHIGKECVHGPGILETQMKVFKKAMFYMLDIQAPFSRRNTPPILIQEQCLPKKVIEGCMKDLIQRKCGKYTAEFAVESFHFTTEQNAKSLSGVGLAPVECEDKTSGRGAWSNRSRTVLRNLNSHDGARAQLHRMLSKDAGGTGLDTIFGKRLILDLQKVDKRINPCDKYLLFMRYEKCLLYSNARREQPRYSILQSAHGLLKLLTQGTICSRLEELVVCWNIQKEMCGPATRGFEHDFILQIESCHIQEYMESIQCEWQDMLFEVYIEAAQKTVWPLASQSGQPLSLDNAYYDVGQTIKSLEYFIQLLQPGVRRIASRCGSEAAERLHTVYRKLSYTLADAFILKVEIHH